MQTGTGGRAVRWLPGLLALLALIAGFWSCENPVGSLKSNTIPDTRLANVPINDTIALYIDQGVIPEQTLYWVGDDPDGYLVAFRYRWTDISEGGTTVSPWITILNLSALGTSPLDTLIIVGPSVTSPYRIYNFLATVNPNDPNFLPFVDALQDSLATGRMFPVPYPSGYVPGDSIRGADPVQIEAPTKGTFIFESPVDSNRHVFEVAAIDNNDAIDPTPATVTFWTRESPGLTVFFTGGPALRLPSGAPAPVSLVLSCPTERAPGLTFTFGGQDPSTNDRDYSWSVDDTLRWSPWNRFPLAVITAADFRETGSDTHMVFLRGKNRWGVLSPIVVDTFRAFVPAIDDPSFPKRLLFINNTRAIGPNPIDSTTLNTFFREVLDSVGLAGQYDVWTMQSRQFRLPSRAELSNYTCVLISSELSILPLLGGQWRFDGTKQDIVYEYLTLGGNLIWSGSPRIDRVISPYFPWATEVFHARQPSTTLPFLQNPTLDFIGVTGNLGYPNISLDSAKVGADSMYAMRQITLGFPEGFGQTISFFRSASNDPVFDGSPVGIRYLAGPPNSGPNCRKTFSSVFFGFPLYFGKKSDVIIAVRKALQDVEQIP